MTVDPRLKRKLAAAAAAAAVLGGAGGAYAVSQKSAGAPRDAFLADVAKRLNVSPQQLQSAFQGALADRLDADVAAGRLTRAQADEILKHAKEGGGPMLPGAPDGPDGPGGPGEPPPPPGAPGRQWFGGPPPPGQPPLPPGPFRERRGAHLGGRPLLFAGVTAAAGYLGLTPAQLRAQLAAGKSLAQVAGDRKKSVAGLKSAIEAAVKSDLDKAVASQRLSAAQEQQVLSRLRARLDAIVNRKGFAAGPPLRFRGRFGHW